MSKLVVLSVSYHLTSKISQVRQQSSGIALPDDGYCASRNFLTHPAMRYLNNIIILLLLIVIDGCQLEQEVLQQTWYPGQLVTAAGHTQSALIRYDKDHDVVMIKDSTSSKALQVLAAKKVRSFSYHRHGEPATFVALPHKNSVGPHRWHFFQVLVAGEFSLVGKHTTIHDHGDMASYERHRYFVYRKQQLISNKVFASQIISELIERYGERINTFISEYQLDLEDVSNQAQLLAYCRAIDPDTSGPLTLAH